MSGKTTHVAEWKKDVVSEYVKLFAKYPIVGALNLENLPTRQLQTMRASMRDNNVIILTSKRRIMKIAIEKIKKTKPGIEKIEPYLLGMPALLFTQESPFKLYKNLQKSKSPAPAKAGQTAPKDIIVPKGPTPFAPGPVIGELGQLKIKAGIEGGKVAIKEDSVVVKQGEKISAKAASILTRLGIEPMEIGLDLVAAYEEGTIYTRDILGVDEKAYIESIKTAAHDSMAVAVHIGYASKDTINVLLGKAHNDAKAVSVSEGIITEETVGLILSKAEAQMLGLKDKMGI
jgi:large subunit ribosomal protein L10